ncbi:MAG: hypothetical protein ACK5NL_11915 [Vibrio fluvialis]
MKTSTFSIALLLSFIANAQTSAQDDAYILTNSEQGTAFLFEKANGSGTEPTYTLRQEVTDKGVEFHFTLAETSPQTDVSYWFANNAMLSVSSEDAILDCQGLTLNGGHWRSPTVYEVANAITNLDPDFVDVMHSLGNENYIARGFVHGGMYLFSNSTNRGKTDTNSANLTGDNPTLCVKE